jgi:hypothetical protein
MRWQAFPYNINPDMFIGKVGITNAEHHTGEEKMPC